MNNLVTRNLDSSSVAVRLGLCAAALAGTAATVSDANATVVTFTTPISIPNTFAGIYINLLSGASAITTGAVPGWDIGPWGNGGMLSMFWNGTPAASSGGVSAVANGAYLDLAAGTTISSASIFSNSSASASAAAFQTTGLHTLGFRFFNETTSAINYGYMTLSTTGTTGFPATVMGWSFENSGGAITIPAVPEPESALMFSLGALALGATGLRRMRRERRERDAARAVQLH